MSYPSTLPSYTSNNTSQTLAANQHAARHTQEEADIVALATKVGVDGSADTSSHDYKLSGVPNGDKAASKAGTETLTNKTLSSPTVSGTVSGGATYQSPTLTTPTITTPTIGDYSSAQHDHSNASKGGQLSSTALNSDLAGGWNVLSTTPTVSSGYNKGNKEFDLTFANTNLSTILSPGMHFKVNRTGSVPTQCVDLESTSSQYASRAGASVSGITFTNNFTIEAWVKLESYAAQTIVSRWDNTSGWRLCLTSNGVVQIQGISSTTNEYGVTYQSIQLGGWVHLAATLDVNGNASTIYINGVAVPVNYGVAAAGTAISQGTGPLQIGSFNGTEFFDGKIADVRVWNTIRTATQIRDNMNQQLVGNEANLVGYWKLNGDFNDSTSNANHLTGQNSAVATNVDNPMNATEYAIITKITYSNPNTVVTVFTGTDYNIPNMTLSAPYYSTQKAPYGFPATPSKWRVITKFNASTGISTGAASTWKQMTGTDAAIPTGMWRVRYGMITTGQISAAAAQTYVVQLSPSGVTPVTDSSYMHSQAFQWKESTNGVYLVGHSRGKARIELTSATTIALWGIHLSGTSVNIYMERSPAFIVAECAYI